VTERVAAIERLFAHGSSFPSLAVDTSGRRWVLKLAGAGPGSRALATESIGLAVARVAGVLVPDAILLDLPRDLPWQTGTDEFYEALQRSVGWNLGIGFVEHAYDVDAAALPDLPEPFLRRLAGVDALLQNVDRTAANPNIIRDAGGAPWAIDFGACLLIDRVARGALEPSLDLPRHHFLANDARFAAATLARETAAALDGRLLAEVVECLPDAWLAALSLPRAALLSRLGNYVESIAAS
jgi:hypothetical protein